MFQVKALFTCDGRFCEVTAKHWVNVAIDEDVDHDSYGGKTVTHFIESTSSPKGWNQETRYGSQRHYCSLACKSSA